MLETRKYEREKQMFESAIKDLNTGWKAELPSKILSDYMGFIERTSDSIEDETLKLCGRSAVANVEYLIGDSKRAYELAQKNWHEAQGEARRWIAAYAYFTTTGLVFCDFEKAMKEMAACWNHHHEKSPSKRAQVEKEITDLSRSDVLTLNPIAAVPRLLILFAALREWPEHEPQHWEQKQYWPSSEAFEEHRSDESHLELRGCADRRVAYVSKADEESI
jgi:hypothetical protein